MPGLIEKFSKVKMEKDVLTRLHASSNVIYHMEVKTTTGGNLAAMHVSENQVDLMTKWCLPDTGNFKHIYMLVRLWLRGEVCQEMSFYPDPLKQIQDGRLQMYAPQGYEVTDPAVNGE